MALDTADWKFQVGVDTRTARSEITSFVTDVVKQLRTIPKVEVAADITGLVNAVRALEQYQQQQNQANNLIRKSGDLLKAENEARSAGDVLRGRSADLQITLAQRVQDAIERAGKAQITIDGNVSAGIERKNVLLSAYEAKITAVEERAKVAGANEVQTQQLVSQAIRESALELERYANQLERTAQQTVSRRVRVAGNAMSTADKANAVEPINITSLAKSIGVVREGSDAIDWLGKVANNTVFKFVEFNLIMKGFEATMNEFSNSLHQASNTQFEQALQRLYAPTIDVNQALVNATVIARKWGSDIQDVQQVIGLWTKNTGDLASATYLANEAEKLHAASGIDTLEVYRSSIALATQLGLTLKDLPLYYNQVTEAALKIAVPLKAVGKSTEEGIRDIFEGVDQDAALLKSLGFELPQIIAINALQVQGLGEKGKEAGKNLATMFAALATQGSGSVFGGNAKGAAWLESIMPKDTLDAVQNRAEDAGDKLLKFFTDNAGKIEQAFKDGDLKVRAQQGETLKAFLDYSKQVQVITDDIKKHSAGKVDLVAETAILTFQGQMQRLQTAVQAFSIALGNRVLPFALQFSQWLTDDAIPASEKLIPELIAMARGIGEVGGAIIALLAAKKVSDMFLDFAKANQLAMQAGYSSAAAMEAEVKAANDAAVAESKLNDILQWKAQQADKAAQAEAANATATAESVGPANAAAEAEGRLAIAQGAVNAEAGKLPGIASAAASGFMGVASAASRALGPLAALFTAFQLVTSAKDAFDKNKVLAAQERSDRFDSESLGGKALDFIGDPAGAFGSAITLVAGKAMGRPGVDDMAAQLATHHTQAGHDMRAALGALAADQAKLDSVRSDNSQFGNLDDYQGELQAKVNAEKAQRDRILQGLADASNAKQSSQEWERLMDEEQKRFAAIQNRAVVPGVDPVGPSPPYDNKPAKAGSPGAQMAQEVRQQAADAASLTTKFQDQVQAAKESAEAEKTLAESYGYTEGGLKRLLQAQNDENYSQNTLVGSLQSAITTQEHSLKVAEAHRDSITKGTPEWNKWNAAVQTAQNSVNRLTGELDKQLSETKLLHAEQAKQAGEYQANAALQGVGLKDYAKTIADLKNQVSSSSGDLSKFLNAEDARKQLNDMLYAADQALKHVQEEGPKGARALDPLHVAITLITQALRDMGKSATDALAGVDAIASKARDEQNRVGKENMKDLATIIGKDTTKYDNYSALFDTYRELNDELTELNKNQTELEGQLDKADANSRPRIEAAIAANDQLRDEINLQLQLAPLLQKVNEIRSTAEYRAVNKGLDQFGTDSIDRLSQNIFGKNKSKNPFTGMLSDMLTSELTSWWKQQSQQITDKLFGVTNQNAQLQKMYQDHVTGAKAAAQQMWNAATNQLAAGNQMAAAQGLPAVQGVTNTGTITLPGGVKIPGLSFGGGSADPHATNQDHVDTLNNSTPQQENHDNTQSIKDNSDQQTKYFLSGKFVSDLQGTLIPFLAMLGASGNGAAGTGLAAGLAGAFLNTKLGKTWLAGKDGTAAAAAGYGLQGVEMGAGFGSLMGGGTHSTWGEVGGGVGGVIGTILGAAGGPLGMAIGGTIGSLAGSLFGSLFGKSGGNADTMPDVYATQQFGQAMGDYLGQDGANGQQFYESNSIRNSLNGQDEAQYLSQWIAQNPTQAKQVLSAQQLALFSGNDQIVDMKNGQLKLGNGQTMQWQSFFTNVQDALSAIKDNTANKPLAPIISIGAYGAGPGYSPNPYNIPGLNTTEYAAMIQNQFSSLPSASFQASSPYATPGVGTTAPSVAVSVPGVGPTAAAVAGQAFKVYTTVNLDGKQLAQIVNAYITQDQARYGQLAA